MPRQITLDEVKLVGINLFQEGKRLRVEANYQLLSANSPVQGVSRDITAELPAEVGGEAQGLWDSILGRVKALESI